MSTQVKSSCGHLSLLQYYGGAAYGRCLNVARKDSQTSGNHGSVIFTVDDATTASRTEAEDTFKVLDLQYNEMDVLNLWLDLRGFALNVSEPDYS